MEENSEAFKLFDAVEVIQLPEGQERIDAYYSHFENQKITIGDVGFIIGDWPNGKFRVEAVDARNAIVWQDNFEPNQLKRRQTTDAIYSRRRINEHWAWQNRIDGEVSTKHFLEALEFARKVMSFAKKNVELLAERLSDSGYQFVNTPLTPPEPDIKSKIDFMRENGVCLPIALQAWLEEVGGVDFCGTHPEWAKTGYAGINHDIDQYYDPWYTDPLSIEVSVDCHISRLEDGPLEEIEIAPDDVTKANVSGNGPISMHCSRQRFDDILVGQHGSFTLLSYLVHSFEWGGFPGFSYIPEAPVQMLREWSKDLIRL